MRMTAVLRTFALLTVPLTLAADPAELSQLQTVYLLPMGNAFDQYLANRLTQLGPYRVVTDPKLADAVFTDRLGKAFETRFEELFPTPAEPVPPAPAEEEKGAEKTGAPTTKELAEEGDQIVPPSSFGRGKGTVFLVDRKSRRVVWSAFENPKTTAPEVLDGSAERLVKQLKRNLAAK